MIPSLLPPAARIPLPRPGRKRRFQHGSIRVDIEKGAGPIDFFLLPGLVPDGPETFIRQKRLLHAHGNTYVVTYPYESFDLDQVIEMLEAFCIERERKGARPAVVIGVSVGGGILIEALRRAREKGRPFSARAFILISPLTCTDDLAPLLCRLWVPIVSDTGDPEKALERGRSFFKSLAARSASWGTPLKHQGWRMLVSLVTPQGWAEIRERSIKKRIDATLNLVTPQGAIARCKALAMLRGTHQDEATAPLSTAPTLILWGSREKHTLNMDGPGTSRLCRPDLASRDFPAAVVQYVYTSRGEEVPHGSLLKHAAAFNRLLGPFLRRVAAP